MKTILFALSLMLIAHSSFAQFSVFLDESTGLYGLKNDKGKVKVQAQYSQAKKLSTLDLVTDRHLRRVEKDGKWGMLDLNTGKELCPIKYDEIQLVDSQNDKIAAVKIGTAWGLLNPFTGKEIIPVVLTKYPYFSGSIFVHQNEEGKFGIVTKEGVFLVPYKYDGIGFAEGDIVPVKLKDKWGAIDIEAEGKLVVPIKYEATGSYSMGRLAVKLKDKWGFVDREGKVVIPIKYESPADRAPGFYEGRTELVEDGTTIYLNPEGKKVDKPKVYNYSSTPSDYNSNPTNNSNSTPSKTDTPKATHTWNCNKCGQSKQASDKPSDSGCRYKDSNGRDANGRHNWSK